MSIHRSLVSGTKGKKHRSVLKRFERVQSLRKAGKWQEGSSLFGLPKVKVVRIRVKKEKAEEAPAAAAGATPEAGAAPAAAPKKEAATQKKEGQK